MLLRCTPWWYATSPEYNSGLLYGKYDHISGGYIIDDENTKKYYTQIKDTPYIIYAHLGSTKCGHDKIHVAYKDDKKFKLIKMLDWNDIGDNAKNQKFDENCRKQFVPPTYLFGGYSAIATLSQIQHYYKIKSACLDVYT